MSEPELQYKIAIISASAAIIGAVIGALSSLLSAWVARKSAESGKIDVYCRFVFTKSFKEGFGIYNSSETSGKVLIVPMWIEVANKSMSTKYIRDFNVIAYNQKKKVAEFLQIQGINIGKETEQEFGNHQSYSFVVEGKTIQRFYAEFILHESELQETNKVFNTLKARYYEENGRKKESVIYSSPEPINWENGAIPYKKEWISIK